MTAIISAAVIFVVFAVGDMISVKTKAIVSMLLVASVVFLAGFWTGVFPTTLFADSTLLSMAGLLVTMLLVHLGTTIRLRDFGAQWRTVIISAVACIGISAAVFFIGQLIIDRGFALVGAPILSGGVVATLTMQDMANKANLPDLAVFATLVMCAQGFVGYPVASLCLKSEAKRIKAQIDAVIKKQEEIGLDVLVHGEFERNDMVEYFGQNLNGFLFTKNAWVQSYGTRCVKPPIVWGDVSRANPITVEWSAYAQSRTSHVMKGMLTGPVTILNWSWPREDITHEQQTQQLALAIRDEVLDLEAAGIKVIQIDEAALREKLPLRKTDWHKKYLDWAIPAFRLAHSAVKPTTQIHTHMCYSEFNDIIRDIDAMDADVISFEASRGDLVVLDAIHDANFETEAGPGVYDIHSPRIPSEAEIEERIYEILKKMDVEKVWINPDCGLKTRGNAETWPSLENLVAAAQAVRAKLTK